jgi:hypothetical protein
MARGFESKQVESQQEDAQQRRTIGRTLTAEEAERLQRQRILELSRARAAEDLQRATSGAHRSMLEQALAAIDEQIQSLKI